MLDFGGNCSFGALNTKVVCAKSVEHAMVDRHWLSDRLWVRAAPLLISPQVNSSLLSLVKILSFLNAFGISNIHESEFKVRSCG